MRKKISKFGIALVLLLSMMGCTTPSQWIADAQVDELCAKDGGIKVYETVTLPKERFNEWGQFVVHDEKYAKPTDEYYRVEKITDIKGSHNSGQMGDLIIYRNHWKIYRRIDHKLLGESIRYARMKGDIFIVDAPSGYTCPEKGTSIESQIFLKSSN